MNPKSLLMGGSDFRRAREGVGVTQAEAARDVGISRSALPRTSNVAAARDRNH